MIQDETGTALQQLALLGEAALGMSDLAVFVWDDDRNYVAVNDAACALTGLTREQLLAMPVGGMATDGAEPHFSVTQARGVHSGRHTIMRPDGPVEIEWVTCHTTIAGLPYLASVCWRGDDV